jgi:hypothetical protein
MGQVDDDLSIFTGADQLAAPGRQPALRQPVGGPAGLIIEEMSQAEHAETGLIEEIQVVQVALQGVSTFQAQEKAQADGIAAAALQQLIQIRRSPHQKELVRGPGDQLLQALGVVQGTV